MQCKTYAAITIMALAVLVLCGPASNSASAAVLCSNSASPCPEGDAYPTGTELHGALSEGSVGFVGEKASPTCSSSSVEGKTTGAGTPLVGEITALTFSGCSLCTFSATHLPYKAEVENTSGGNGILTLSNGGSGVPQVKASCSGFSCSYGAGKVSLDLDGGAPASLSAVSEPLTKEAGEKSLCGETLKWSAVYRVSAPTAAFIAARSAPTMSICSTSASVCPEGSTYPIGTQIRGTLSKGSASFVSEKASPTCSSSSVEGKTTGAGTPLVGEITALTFSGCSLCTFSATHLPYKAEVESTSGGNGTLTLSNGGSGVPQILASCAGFSCTYGAGKISLDIVGGTPGSLSAASEPLTKEAGEKSLCGETLKWSSTYGISEPMSLFVGVAGTRKLYFGINANTRAGGTTEQNLAAETGVDHLREDLEWWRVEPSNNKWQWSETDTLFETAAERGLSILPILDSPPCWAVPKGVEDCGNNYPSSDADYADFVAHAVARYGPGGEFWSAHPKLNGELAPRYFEIWNEPYIKEFTNGEINPARYTTLYKAAVIAGREANSSTRYLAESTTNVFIEGTGIVNWAGGMVKAEPSIGNYIDGIAIHPYPFNHDPYYQPVGSIDASFKNTDHIYADWVANGIRRPVWVTEVGYASCTNVGRCVFGETMVNREELKAKWLGQMLSELGSEEYSYVHAVYLYNLRQWESPETPLSDTSAWYGIVNGAEEHRLAWQPFADVVKALKGTPTGHAIILGHTIGGGNASFTFTVTDPTASLSCQLDSGSWTACASPKSYIGVGAGSHTFRVRATNAEATEASPATYSW